MVIFDNAYQMRGVHVANVNIAICEIRPLRNILRKQAWAIGTVLNIRSK